MAGCPVPDVGDDGGGLAWFLLESLEALELDDELDEPVVFGFIVPGLLLRSSCLKINTKKTHKNP